MIATIKTHGATLHLEAQVNGSKSPDVKVRHGAGGPILLIQTIPVLDDPKRNELVAEFMKKHGKAAGDELLALIVDCADQLMDIRAAPEDTPQETGANLQTPLSDDERARLWEVCRHLAVDPRILDRAAEAIGRLGVVGAKRQVQLAYLAMTSRLLDRPVSLAIKGPSAAGKSFPLEQTLKLFPKDSFYEWTAMSERALVYDDAPLQHRMLVLYEAAGMGDDIGSYLLRSLLSEGRVRYMTVEKTEDGIKSKIIERPGPTGLITTTTKVTLHPENETRLLSITVSDSPEQTRKVFEALASEAREPFDAAPWRDFQRWIEAGDHRVSLPFAQLLATLIPTTAVRLRRDFGTLLNLIRAHAVLHQASRERDDLGRIIAMLDDYAAVRELVADLMAEGVEIAVSRAVRETVEAVRVLRAGSPEQITVSAVARHLHLDVSAASRRVQTATRKGYLKNEETRDRLPARLVLGEPLPESSDLLPLPELLDGVCRFALETEGVSLDEPIAGQTPFPGEDFEQGDAWEAEVIEDDAA